MRKINNDHFFVITGGPGTGKTSLLDELKKRRFKVVPEIAREIIKEQKELNGQALPWKDKELYKEIMLERSIRSYEQMDQKKASPVFFDRGILDTICYAKLIQSEINEKMDAYAENYRYNKMVFLLPPWLDIYTRDDERKQGWEEAVLTYRAMVETYEKYGYEIIEIPKFTVKERAELVLEILKLD